MFLFRITLQIMKYLTIICLVLFNSFCNFFQEPSMRLKSSDGPISIHNVNDVLNSPKRINTLHNSNITTNSNLIRQNSNSNVETTTELTNNIKSFDTLINVQNEVVRVQWSNSARGKQRELSNNVNNQQRNQYANINNTLAASLRNSNQVRRGKPASVYSESSPDDSFFDYEGWFDKYYFWNHDIRAILLIHYYLNNYYLLQLKRVQTLFKKTNWWRSIFYNNSNYPILYKNGFESFLNSPQVQWPCNDHFLNLLLPSAGPMLELFRSFVFFSESPICSSNRSLYSGVSLVSYPWQNNS